MEAPTVFEIEMKGVKAFKRHLKQALKLANQLQVKLDELKQQGLEIEVKV